MELRIASIPLMLDYVSGLDSGPPDRAAAARILSHEDYQFELRRYGIPSAGHLVDYFSRLTSIAPEDIPDLSGNHRRNALREKHAQWLDCARNPQTYDMRCQRMKAMFTDRFMADMQHRLAAMFPAGTRMIPDPAVVSTLSFGQSFGYPYEGAIHLDLFGVETACTMEELPRIVLHELHHLQINKMAEEAGLHAGGLSLLESYILQFAGEGLAVKFCNNAEGVVSRRLEPDLPPNQNVPALSTLKGHFPELFQLFCDTVRRIRAGAFTQEDLAQQNREVWLNPFLYGEPHLEQMPLYSLGNELYGCIYDAFGLDILYECFYHPAQVIPFFNRAGCGYAIPQ